MRKDTRRSLIATRVILALYGAVMVYLLFCRGGSVAYGDYWQKLKLHCNFMPGRTMLDMLNMITYNSSGLVTFAVKNLVGNVVCFIPLGLLLPWNFKKLQRAWIVLDVSMAVVACIELVQLFTLRGVCDIDDFILNVCGSMIGYGLWMLWRKLAAKKKGETQ